MAPTLLGAAWTIAPSWFTSGPIFFSNLEFFGRVLGPFFVRQFILLPALAGLFLGRTAAVNSLVSMILAELLTNVHSFIVIVTNHAGDDLYRFDDSCAPNSPEFFLRQVLSSANYRTGGDANDFWHGFLNYQVEHQCVRREHT